MPSCAPHAVWATCFRPVPYPTTVPVHERLLVVKTPRVMHVVIGHRHPASRVAGLHGFTVGTTAWVG
jgi:hypothetical protein